MPQIAILRSQLDEADALFDQFLAASDRHCGLADANGGDLERRVAHLAGLIRLQFALEREHLYPRLLGAGSRRAEVMGRLFERELEPLARDLERFVRRWPTNALIAASVDQFRYEAGMLIAALRERNRRLRRDILPLADTLVPVTPPWLARAMPNPAPRAATA